MELSQRDRDICAHAIKLNTDLIAPVRSSEIHPTIQTMDAMAAVAQIPYNSANLHYDGDTLDRHHWSPYGNSGEVTPIVTLILTYGWAIQDFTIERSKQQQYYNKVDITTNHAELKTIQCKPIEYGSPFPGRPSLLDRDIFISYEDVKGTATHIAVTCAFTRRLILIDKAIMATECCMTPRKDDEHFPMEPHRYRELRIKQGYSINRCIGHYLNAGQVQKYGTIIHIPAGVACVGWDDVNQQVVMTVGDSV